MELLTITPSPLHAGAQSEDAAPDLIPLSDIPGPLRVLILIAMLAAFACAVLLYLVNFPLRRPHSSTTCLQSSPVRYAMPKTSEAAPISLHGDATFKRKRYYTSTSLPNTPLAMELDTDCIHTPESRVQHLRRRKDKDLHPELGSSQNAAGLGISFEPKIGAVSCSPAAASADVLASSRQSLSALPLVCTPSSGSSCTWSTTTRPLSPLPVAPLWAQMSTSANKLTIPQAEEPSSAQRKGFLYELEMSIAKVVKVLAEAWDSDIGGENNSGLLLPVREVDKKTIAEPLAPGENHVV